MATGAPGTNGVWQYGEDDSEATFSALLNKVASTTDTQIGADRTRLTAVESAWTSYTPTFSSANGALNIGNGVVSFRYKQVGKTVHVIGKYTLGTTSVMGNTLDFTMPTNIVSNITIATPLGRISFWDNGSTIYEGWALQISGNAVRAVASLVSGTRVVNQEVSGVVPMTWNSGDVVFFHGFYEAA